MTAILTQAVVLTSDSVTLLTSVHFDCVLVTGSHGAASAGRYVARAGVRAAIFNDAGGGLDMAGLSSLGPLADLGVAAATVSHDSARIGDAADMLARGVISHANRLALDLGVAPGDRCDMAAARLRNAAPHAAFDSPPDQRFRLAEVAGVQVWGLDSASLASSQDAGDILVTGSHGGLLGGAPGAALKGAALCAIYNDAGVGADGAGIARLAALDDRAIAAAALDYRTAMIGDARSGWNTGVVSFVNARAFALGGRVGQTTKTFAAAVARSRAALDTAADAHLISAEGS